MEYFCYLWARARKHNSIILTEKESVLRTCSVGLSLASELLPLIVMRDVASLSLFLLSFRRMLLCAKWKLNQNLQESIHKTQMLKCNHVIPKYSCNKSLKELLCSHISLVKSTSFLQRRTFSFKGVYPVLWVNLNKKQLEICIMQAVNCYQFLLCPCDNFQTKTHSDFKGLLQSK